jgi:uncharacterized delta-60 repeat protein
MKIKSHIPRKYALLFLLIITMFSVKSQGGQLDLSFAIGTGFSGFAVNSLAIQPDGKIIAAGSFTDYNGTTVNGIARINANGTIDNTFNSGVGFNQGVVSIALQADGKIIAGGFFTSYNGTPCNYIVRLNTNGTIDPSFNTGTGFDNNVMSVAIQTDGKIIAGGFFTSFNSTGENYIVRLNSNGSLDPLFNIGTGFNMIVAKVLIQSDGKILAGGMFSIYNGINSNKIARINTNGTLDATFSTTGTGFNTTFFCDLALQTDGKVIVGGDFTNYNGISYNRLARLNINGALDATFNIGSGFNSTIHSLEIQSNGKIVVGGEFTNFNGVLKNSFVRLNTTGTLDASFDTGLGLGTGTVSAYSLKIQPDGKILLGGTFNSYNGISREKIARVNAICIPPTITISASSNPVCAGSTTTVTANGGTSYTWNPGNTTGSFIITSPTVNTTYTVTAGSGTCTNTNSISLIMKSLPNQPGSVIGNTLVATGSSQTYSTLPIAGATSYNWSLPSGWSGSSTTNIITVGIGSLGSGYVIGVNASNSCGSSNTTTISVSTYSCAVPNSPGAIYGNTLAIANTMETYSIAPVANATSYAWYLWPPGVVLTTTTNVVSINVGGTNDTLHLSVYPENSCGWGNPSDITVFKSAGTGSGSSTPQAIAAGYYYSLSLCSNGTVVAWGDNGFGQFGNGITTDSNVPTQAGSLTDITAVAAGAYHSVALKNDGTVWSWAYNSYGQLGNGTTNNSTVPVQVAVITGITAIAGGGNHSLALKSDGTVWAWGRNSYGQIGNGSCCSNSKTPVQVNTITGIVSISGGWAHSIALKSDGTVWSWGYNNAGQLGNGTNTNSYFPIQISSLTGITAIVAGYYHSLALKNDGTVWAWGNNSFGQLGNGTTTASNVPVLVSSLTGITTIAAGEDYSLALKNDGTVRTWGRNGYGKLGNGTTTTSNIPVQVSFLTGVVAIEGGGEHSLAIKSDGTAWAWGFNGAGQLGNGTTVTLSNVPVQVTGLCGNAIGVSEFSKNNLISIYPNPNSGIFQIKSDESLKNATIKIYNTQGQIIFESTQFVSEIDLSNQPKGIYFIQIKSEEKIINKKIVVQ